MLPRAPFLALLLALCATLVACGEYGNASTTTGTAKPPAQSVKIVNWNVHNFVNDVLDSNVLAEEIDTNWLTHKTDIARVLRELDPDIVMLQEIENGAVLEALNAELDDAFPFLVLYQGNDPRGINIALLSKIEVVLAKTHRSEKFKKIGDPQGPAYRYARDCVEVHIKVGERPVVLLGVHYKAKENDNPDKRLAEAQHTRAIADQLAEEDPERAIVILGDFNDTPGSSPYDWTLGNDPSRYRNAADHVQAPLRWTFNYKGQLELVDQQMANSVLYEMLDPNTVEILHTDAVETASDHAPIVATYEIQ